jgi:hypothetical protein
VSVKQPARPVRVSEGGENMHWEYDSTEIRGLREYIELVADAVGLGDPSWFVQTDQPANAYIALAERLPLFPNRDVALLWDEDTGWALGLESTLESTSSGELLVLRRLCDEVVPSPEDVAAAVREAFARPSARVPDPALRRGAGRAALLARLSNYAGPRREFSL